MSGDRRRSSFSALDLDDVEDRPRPTRPTASEIDHRSSMPSRDPSRVAELRKQNNISMPLSQDARFADLCRHEGKSKTQMLIAMMDLWEGR